MKWSRVVLLDVLLLLAAGIFAAAPYRASDFNDREAGIAARQNGRDPSAGSGQAARLSTKIAEGARLNNIGVAYMNQQLFEKALKEFEAASAQDPALLIAKLNRGVALLNLQKVDEAKALLEEVVRQAPKDAHAWYNLGLYYKNTNDTDAAAAAFKHVTEIDPNDADTWYFLVTVYAQAKQYAQAIDAFEHALKLNPLHASAEFGISRAYQQSGNTNNSREHLKKLQYIKDNKLGSPMSLAYGEQGQYSRAEESAAAIEKVPPQIPVKFVDVTAEAGLMGESAANGNALPLGMGSGACFLDFDGDGKIDVFLAEGGPGGGMALYHSLGNGKFEDVTKKAGLNPKLHGIGCTAGDYDNDGATDLAVTVTGQVLLLHNQKNGTFSDATQKSGIKSDGFSVSPTFIDYDHDGDLDLYVTRFKMVRSSSTGSKTNGSYWAYDSVIEQTSGSIMWRNNGDGTFTDVSDATGLGGNGPSFGALGTDYNNDRAIDLVVSTKVPTIFVNPREGKFVKQEPWAREMPGRPVGIAVLDFDHDGWMDLAFTHSEGASISLWRNVSGKKLEAVPLPKVSWVRAFGIAAIDYDNDGWVDLVAVGETKEGKGEVRLFRNLGPDGFKDVTADVGLDKIQLKDPRAIITGDYDGDGATDLLITQNHGPAVLLWNEGANRNHWLRLSLKGLNDNKSAIGTKVEVFSGGNRQKFEIYGSNGYLGQNSTDLVVGLGESKDADIVRMLWPTGVLQDEIQIAGDRRHEILEIDRRGSSCPTLFVWNGERYEFVADMLGAGVVGHWIGPNQRDIPRPVEYIKIDRNAIREKEISRSHAACHPEQSEGPVHSPASCMDPSPPNAAAQDDKGIGRPEKILSFRFMEPLEEAVYLDQVRLMAVDHPADIDVYPNEYFASNPPYPPFKVVVSRDARLPAGAWDEHGHDVLPELLAHRYFGDFALTQFLGFAQPHTLTLDLGQAYRGGPLWLLLHGEVEYFSANSMYAASQAGIEAISPYVEAMDALGKWKRVMDDMGFPAGGTRTMTADLTGKLPP